MNMGVSITPWSVVMIPALAEPPVFISSNPNAGIKCCKILQAYFLKVQADSKQNSELQRVLFYKKNILIYPINPDGDYTLTVDHFNVQSNGTYTLTINGLSVSKPWELKNIAFTTSDDTEKMVVRINKSGNKYTLTKL
jgi:hypothetical protein